jgi:hypothetical protein
MFMNSAASAFMSSALGLMDLSDIATAWDHVHARVCASKGRSMRACVVDASRSDADQSHPSKVAIRESSGGSRF